MLIGLTGGIASGKSLAAKALKELGAHVLSADEASRQAVEPGSPGLMAVAAEFGRDMLTPEGSLDRRKLGELVFREEAARLRLNAVLHPLIKQILSHEAGRILAVEPGAIVVLEAPLLIEAGWQDMVDRVWLVTAPEGERIRRIMARDGLTEEEAALRIAAQMRDEERAAYAHEIIDNHGSPRELWERVRGLYGELTGEHEQETGRGTVDKGDCGGADSPCAADGGGADT